MNNRRISVFTGCILCLTLVFLLCVIPPSHVRGDEAGRLDVVCTTTQLSSIVNAVGGECFHTQTIIPFGMCPGHFELSPGEARKLLEAPLLLHHGYERFLTDLDYSGRSNKVPVSIMANWMIPGVHVRAVGKVSTVLSEKMPDRSDNIGRSADRYTAAIKAAEDSLRTVLDKFRETNVISAAMNRDFVEWTGVTVVGDYPRDEDISIAKLHTLISEGRKKGVRLVVDNRQSSGKVGKTIADELGVPLVVMTNFPGENTGAEYPYIEALQENSDKLIRALQGNDDGKSIGGS